MFFVALLFIIIAYVVGSLNCAILISKVMHLPDPRQEGSGNPGATNMLRMHGKQVALLVLAGDILKGFIPVLLAKLVGVTDFGLACVALAAVVGHMFPVFFKFAGGKGAATAFGVLLALSFWVTLLVAIVWAVVVFVTRYVSLAVLIAMVLAAVLILFVHTSYFLPVAVAVTLIIWRHHDNIERLKTGMEDKVEW